MKAKPATIEDVAALAGVSVATVSRAIRNLPNVADPTREKVRVAAATLRYRANPSAASMRGGRTPTAAMVVPMLDSWYFSQVMAGAEAVLSEAGYDLLVFKVDSQETRHRLLAGPQIKRAEGLILVDIYLPLAEIQELQAGHLHVVSVGLEIDGASSVMVDDRGVAEEAVRHLVNLGHREIGLIGGEAASETQNTAVQKQRLAGYEAALVPAGIKRRNELQVSGEFSLEGGRSAMAALLDLELPPSAVFAMSDEMAFGALLELRTRRLSAPADMCIIGVDDHEFSQVVGLTTIRQSVTEHGAHAARMLLEHLEQPDLAPTRHMAGTSFIDRGSTRELKI